MKDLAELPYNPAHLERTDVYGARAKREAAAFWHARKRHCDRWLREAESDIESHQGKEGEEDLYAFALNRAMNWKRELREAEEMIEKVESLILVAWESV